MEDKINAAITSKYDFLDKSAYFLMQIGEDFTSEVMTFIPQRMVTEISARIIKMRSIPRSDALAIMEEFAFLIKSNDFVQSGGLEKASSILQKAFGSEESKVLINKLMRKMNKHELFAFLDNIPSAQIADFISQENPQTIAIILAHLSPDKAAEIMENLTADDAIEASIRLSQLNEVSPMVVKNISMLLESKMELLNSQKIAVGGVRNLSEIFNKMSQTNSQEVLQLIELFDAQLHTEIIDNMFVFEDILKIDRSCLRTLVTEIPEETLIKGLKNGDEEILEFFLLGFSADKKEEFKESMEYAGHVKAKELEQAQIEITSIAQKLLENETIYFDEELD